MSSKVCIVDLTIEYNNKLPKYVMEAACEYAKKHISLAKDYDLEVCVDKEVVVFGKNPRKATGLFISENAQRYNRTYENVQDCVRDFIAGWKSAYANTIG